MPEHLQSTAEVPLRKVTKPTEYPHRDPEKDEVLKEMRWDVLVCVSVLSELLPLISVISPHSGIINK